MYDINKILENKALLYVQEEALYHSMDSNSSKRIIVQKRGPIRV